MNQLRHQAAHGLDAERERRHVEQQLDPARRPREFRPARPRPARPLHPGFSSVCGRARNSSSTAERTSGMRVDPPTSTTSSICSTVTPASCDAIAAGPERPIDDRLDQAVEHVARDLALIAACRDIPDRSSACGTKDSSSLALITARRRSCTASRGLPEISSPHSDLNVFERDAQQQIVDIVAAQVRVAVGRQHFEDAVVQPQDRNVERAAAQIVNRDDAFFALVETVGQRRGGRLIHQAQDFEAGDAAGVLGGLALGVVEIRGHGDDGLRDRLAQRGFGVLLQLAQNVRGNLRRRDDLCRRAAACRTRFAALRQMKREQLQLFLMSARPRPISRFTE